VPVPVSRRSTEPEALVDFHTGGSPWGGTIDSYDAVFRVNKVQLQTENRNAYSCKVGARVDFAINALTVGQFEELVNNSIAEKFLSQHKDVLHSLAGLGSATVTKDRDTYKTAVNAARVQNASDGWRVFLPSNAVLHGRGLGSGSGSTAVALAMSLCRSVDAYGFGVFRDDVDAADYRYLHFYQDVPRQGHVGGADGVTGGAQVLNSELRNAVWDAFGLVNFVWW